MLITPPLLKEANVLIPNLNDDMMCCAIAILSLVGVAWATPHHTPEHQVLNAGCDLIAAPGSTVSGRIQLKQERQGYGAALGPVSVAGAIHSLSPGLHGFHLHRDGSTADSCKAAGPHFNPKNVNHGAPTDASQHAGDFGNIHAGEDGVANVNFHTAQISLDPSSSNGAIGRTFVVHALPDDLGRAGTVESTKTGTAGARIACCIISA